MRPDKLFPARLHAQGPHVLPAAEPCWRSQRPASLDVQFLAERHQGSSVRSRCSAHADGTRLHASLREEDGKELAWARTGWAAR